VTRGHTSASWTSHPVLAVCGWKNSGKTTLLEQAIRHLRGCSLKVGVVKHDAHGLEVDKAGSDSDRLFRAGAEVALEGPDETMHRFRQDSSGRLELSVRDLLRHNDVVLVEGHKQTPFPKVWLTSPDNPSPPENLTNLRAVFPWGEVRAPQFLDHLDRWLHDVWRRRPRLGGVLIGGCSSRMDGSPKQLLEFGGRSLLEIAVRALEPHVDQVVLLGSGDIPDSFWQFERIPDVRGVKGPLAGVLSGLRWSPETTWCISACDMPLAKPEAMAWVLSERKPGRWAILPRRSQAAVESLFAVYEPQAHRMLEAVAAGDSHSIQNLQDEETVICPTPPDRLLSAWTNVNTCEEFSRLSKTA